MKRFPGYDGETDEYSAEVHRNHIFGQHVADYMRLLQDDDEEMYKRQFSMYIKEGIDADSVRKTFSISMHKMGNIMNIKWGSK